MQASTAREKNLNGTRHSRNIWAWTNPRDKRLKQFPPCSSTCVRKNPQEQLPQRSSSNPSKRTTFIVINHLHLLFSLHPPPIQSLFPAWTPPVPATPPPPSTPRPPPASLHYKSSANPSARYSSTPTSSFLNRAHSYCTLQYLTRYIVPRSQRRGRRLVRKR